MSDPSPQFSTAEYAATPGSEHCKSCNQTLGSQYYRVNGALTCAYCAEQTKLRLPVDTHSTFARGLAFGIGGAILGLVIYSAFGIITGLVIGYVSLAVGYIVGKAMMKGSGGIGGQRYQIAAVLLTYAAVSLAAVPIGIAQANKAHRAARAEESRSIRNSTGPSTDGTASLQEDPSATRHRVNWGSALVSLTLIGLASPFLELQDPLHGLIGLVILFVGLQIAWKLTR